MRSLILSAILESFFLYYGLDWIAFLSGVYGMYLISEKRRIGFIFQGVSVVCAVIVSFIASQYGFVVSNFVMLGVVVYGFLNWKDNESE